MPPQTETEPPLPPEPEEPTLSVVALPPTPLSSPPTPAPAASTDSPQPTETSPAKSPAPSLDPTIALQPSAAPQQATSTPESIPSNSGNTVPPETPPVFEFPHLEGAVAGGCGGDYGCYTLPNTPDFREAAAQLQQDLRGQGYEVISLADQYDEPGRAVYRLIDPDGREQYLLVFSNDTPGQVAEALYVVVDEVMTLEELKSA